MDSIPQQSSSLSDVQLNDETCQVCRIKFNDDAPKILHDIYCKGNQVCSECDIQFELPEMLREHCNTEHARMVCRFGCDESNLRMDEINKHINHIHDIAACFLCGLITSSQSNKLNIHLQEKHNVDLRNLRLIEDCSEKTKLYRLQRENNKREVQKVLCNFCDDDLTSRMQNVRNLISHFVSDHAVKHKIIFKSLEKNPFSMTENLKSMVNSTSWLDYFTILRDNESAIENQTPNEVSVDFDVQNISCIADPSDTDLSDAESNQNDDQRTDELLTNPSNNVAKQAMASKQETCDFCDTHLITRKCLMEHLKNNHGFQVVIDNCQCHLCHMIFKTKLGVKNHLQSKHSILAPPTTVPFLCPFCQKQFKNRKTIRNHIATHTDCNRSECHDPLLGYRCLYCINNYWTVEEREEHHIRDHMKTAASDVMICYLCGDPFVTKICLQKHQETTHPAEQPIQLFTYKCVNCRIAFPSLDLIGSHMQRLHPGLTATYCSVQNCRRRIQPGVQCKQHNNVNNLSKSSNAGERLECNTCRRKFKNPAYAFSHFKRIHKVKVNYKRKSGLKCRVCKICFLSRRERQEHFASQHSGHKEYQCNECEKSFNSKSGLYTHKQVHDTTSKNICPTCNKSFVKRDTLNEHILIHKEPQFSCSHCPKKFVQKSNLSRHERIHTGKKPYACNFCNKSFSDSGARATHQSLHTRQPDDIFKCIFCEKTFLRKSKLQYHLRTHTGENLISCDVCTKQFTNAYDLKTHKELHKSRLKCPQCDKLFSSKRSLARHLTGIHSTEDKGHCCPICQKKFGSRVQMREHVMIHGKGNHIWCTICDFKCSTVKSARKHLLEQHHIKKGLGTPRLHLRIRTPEEEGILPVESYSVQNANAN